MTNQVDRKANWAATKRLTIIAPSNLVLVSIGAGILFHDPFDKFSLCGAPLGFS